MSLAINILITLIGLTVVVALCYNYVSKVFKDFAEKYKLSHLFGMGKKNYGALGEIFHQYHHKNIEDWSDYISSQASEIKEEAITKLINHIDGSPAAWGSITPDAIKAIANFQNKDHVTLLKSILSTCKKVWEKYTVAGQCYEAACRSIIRLGQDSAKKILSDELSNKGNGTKDIALSVINSFAEFSEEDDISALFTKVLVDSNETHRVRTHALNTAQSTRPDQEFKTALIDAIEEFIKNSSRVFSADDSKIFEQIFNLITKEPDEKTFDLIMECCNSSNLSKVTIKSLEFVLKSSASSFSPKQLYMLINIANDDFNQLASSLATNFNLSPAEKNLCLYKDVLTENEFKKSSVVDEALKKPLEIPPEIKDLYEKLKEGFRSQSNKKQSGSGGGLALTGLAENEKLYLSRAFAAEKRWTFVYGLYEDLVGSGTAAKQFTDVVQKHKPCIVYLDDVSKLTKNTQDPFAKTLKPIFSDQMVFGIGTIREDADIDEDGCSVIFKRTDELKTFFPQAVQISSLQDFQKNIILQSKLALIQPGRGADTWEQYNILKPANGMTAFEFEKFLTKYFRASLLVHGKMIDISSFEELDTVDFEGRGSL